MSAFVFWQWAMRATLKDSSQLNCKNRNLPNLNRFVTLMVYSRTFLIAHCVKGAEVKRISADSSKIIGDVEESSLGEKPSARYLCQLRFCGLKAAFGILKWTLGGGLIGEHLKEFFRVHSALSLVSTARETVAFLVVQKRNLNHKIINEKLF